MDQSHGNMIAADTMLSRLQDDIRDVDRTVVQLQTKQTVHEQAIQQLSTKTEATAINVLQALEGVRRFEDTVSGLRTYNEQVRVQLQATFGNNSSMHNFGEKITDISSDLRAMQTRLDECERKIAEHLTITSHVDMRYREQFESLRDELATLDNKQTDLTEAVDDLKESVSEFRTIMRTMNTVSAFIVTIVTILAALQSMGVFDFFKKP